MRVAHKAGVLRQQGGCVGGPGPAGARQLHQSLEGPQGSPLDVLRQRHRGAGAEGKGRGRFHSAWLVEKHRGAQEAPQHQRKATRTGRRGASATRSKPRMRTQPHRLRFAPLAQAPLTFRGCRSSAAIVAKRGAPCCGGWSTPWLPNSSASRCAFLCTHGGIGQAETSTRPKLRLGLHSSPLRCSVCNRPLVQAGAS